MSAQAQNPDPSFLLSQTDGRPMYQQIMDQVRQRVAVGDWAAGMKLPSIRELAAATRVSVITVKRAYLELERGGVIVTQQGRGSFVCEAGDSDQLQREELGHLLEKAAALATSLELSPEDLRSLLARFAPFADLANTEPKKGANPRSNDR